MTGALARAAALCAALVFAAAASAGEDASGAPPTEYTFAALGDAPYDSDEEQQFIAMLAEMNRASLAFVVHVGDFKSAMTVCSDELYFQRRDWFRLSHHPFVYVPGDNDWTDCARPFLAARDPLERLGRLRDLFFDSDQALGQGALALTRQLNVAAVPGARYPEHARWVHGRVLHFTLNLPGPDNNRARMPEEAARRSAAVQEWVKSGFALARELRLPAVIVFMQANLWRRNGLPRPAFAQIAAQIAHEAQAYEGQVLLVHGDTHEFRFGPVLNDPVTRKPVANVVRLEVYGSPVVNWVRVRVTVKGNAATFSVSPGSSF